ncbi:O-antigen ligase family protein [methane-oxidizing endosymbiont of Gigantopelta aegis]|uniref:O-antigen ligase family protein n=1 Tax=methane-oxidizing endosymbiont of Gigantopelta aegis TaxID=2794938 RepID=UPI001FD87648|nr:O-antigen ligase family protein [methane-oxidizing endosymbiont of Gigantopelta aegis]
MGVLLFMLLWNSKRKILVLPLILISGFLTIGFLPEAWLDRMSGISSHQDESAMSRIRAWKDGWYFTLGHPFTGSGFEGWHWVTEREWHSSYVEMFAEHGFVAFAMWMALIIGTIISLTLLPKKTKNIEGMEWVENYCYMIRASIITYMVGGLFLGLSYWDLLYHLIFISILIKQFALEQLDTINKKPNLSYQV